MKTKMIINAVDPEEYRVAFIKDGLLDGFHIETVTAEQKVGNIYKAVVEKTENRLQACFVNYGADRNGFLPASDIHPEYYREEVETTREQPVPPVEKIVSRGQELLVQVTKEMPGRKGAHLTTYVSMAGRYLVLTPGRTTNGVSRKIEDEEERQRLKSVMSKMRLPEGVGYIVRTMAAGQNKKELSRDLNRLLRMWNNIRKRVKTAPVSSLIHKEQDICLRTLRDYFTSDVTEIVVDDKETYAKISEYMKIISPRQQRTVRLYKEDRPIFDKYDVERQIQNIYSNRVGLKSGGYIVIDPTEALISIDVNSGRGMVGRDIESMAFRINTEAAREIARQLRLRDMGGLVVIDFIDMRERKNNREVEKELREELKKDRAKISTSNISKFGLLELSRQRLRPSIESKTYQACRYCGGRGIVMSVESASVSYMRRILMGLAQGDVVMVNGNFSPEVATYLQNRKRKELAELEKRYGVTITIRGDSAIPPGDGKLDFIRHEQV